MRLLIIILIAIMAPAAATSSLAAQTEPTYHLPIVFTPPTVARLVFGTAAQCTGDFGNLLTAPAQYTYGFKRLYVATEVEGGEGRAWRLEWSIDGAPSPGLDRNGTIIDFVQVVDEVVVYGENGTCGSAIPRGVYTVRIYLDEQLFQEGSATVQ